MKTYRKKRIYSLVKTESGNRSYVPEWWYVDDKDQKVRKAGPKDPDQISEPDAEVIPAVPVADAESDADDSGSDGQEEDAPRKRGRKKRNPEND